MKELISWTALITPFHADGSVDFSSLEYLIKKQAAAGNGLVLFGSTGEGVSLEEAEKRQIIDCCCHQNLLIPILVGIAGFHLPALAAWIKECNRLPIAGYQLCTPIYTRPGPLGQAHWFRTLLRSTSKPCMLYNIPLRAGCPLAVEAVAALENEPNFWAIKDGSGSPRSVRQYLQAHNRLKIFAGNDPDLFPMIQAGASGSVAVMTNAWPIEGRHAVLQALKGESPSSALIKASAAINQRNPISTKALLHARGWIRTPYLRPPLHHGDISHLTELQAIDQLFSF